MNDTDLYRQILGIEAPWYVERVELDLPSEAVRIYLAYRIGTEWSCPACGTLASVHDHRDEREWRHLDSCQLKTLLVASLPRVRCSRHGVLTVAVPWTEPESRFTQMFERFAIDVLQATGVQARAASLLRLSAGQVHDLMRRAVVRGRQRRDSDQLVAHASLDEKSFKHGRQYVTVLGDLCGRRVLDVAEGHSKQAAENVLLCGLSESQRKRVKSVSMDMWLAFRKARESVREPTGSPDAIGHGIYIDGGSSGLLCENNVCYDCGHGGIRIQHGTSCITVLNNISAFNGYGLGIDSNSVSNCYNGAAGGCTTGSALSRTTTNPQAGVWEVTVDARRNSDAVSAPFTLTVSILGASVSPNPDVIASATLGVPVARSYTLTNLFGAFTGRAVGTSLGSALIATPSIANLAQNVTSVTVAAGSTSLRATIGSPSDPAADQVFAEVESDLLKVRGVFK